MCYETLNWCEDNFTSLNLYRENSLKPISSAFRISFPQILTNYDYEQHTRKHFFLWVCVDINKDRHVFL